MDRPRVKQKKKKCIKHKRRPERMNNFVKTLVDGEKLLLKGLNTN